MITKAKVQDAEEIYRLLVPAVNDGKVLHRTVDEIYEAIRAFTLYRDDATGGLLGVASLHIYGPELGEVRSVVVDVVSRGRGIGRELVEHCLYEGALLGLKKIFVLTYEPDFFKRVGFRETVKEVFPEKVFKDCLRCPKIDACDEKALIFELS